MTRWEVEVSLMGVDEYRHGDFAIDIAEKDK